MAWYSKSFLFFRRLSVFYLFFVVLGVFMALYFFKYVPGNKEELNQRGQRVLKQLCENIIDKDKSIRAILSPMDTVSTTSTDLQNLKTKKGSFEKFNQNIGYDIISRGEIKNEQASKFFPFYHMSGQDWSIIYTDNDSTPTNAGSRYGITISFGDFLRQLLSTREDVFDTYFIMMDTSKSMFGKIHNLQIIYEHDEITSSPILNADTAWVWQKNSDFSGVSDIKIADDDYKIFFRPFHFHNRQLFLAGLVPAQLYNDRIRATPLQFVPISIILIIFIFISLPYLKVFLLSPKESINSRDVLSTAVSFYLGAAAGCLIMFYVFLIYISGLTSKNRLIKFSDLIYADIENEIDLASKQLSDYDKPLYMDTAKWQMLTSTSQEYRDDSAIDQAFIPQQFQNISRVFWIDSEGHTIAKWNPFNYVAGLTPVYDYDFFNLLKAHNNEKDADGALNYTVVYPGKSNVTGEFQTFVAKPSTRKLPSAKTGSPQAFGIGLASFLSCSVKPVIPPGFGFCVIDYTGKILIDADDRRNLSANIIDETEDDPTLRNVMKYKNDQLLFNIELYGEPCIAKVRAIKDQPLYLVTYYNKKRLSKNIFRIIYFSSLSLIYIFLVFMICVLISTYSKSTLAQLNFKLNKIEWIRPSASGEQSYSFSFIYFSFLFVLTLLFFIGVMSFANNFDTILYWSALVPLYVFSGFLASRAKEIVKTESIGNEDPPSSSGDNASFKQLLKACRYPFTFIFVTNIVIFQIEHLARKSHDNFWIIFFLQIIIFIFLCWLFFKQLFFLGKFGDWLQRKGNSYLHALFLSILLIGVMPAIGLLTYSFFAEKTQHKKDKELEITQDFFSRANYLQKEIVFNYKPSVIRKLNAGGFANNLICNKSIYLTDHDEIICDDQGNSRLDSGFTSSAAPDQSYSVLTDKLYSEIVGNYENISIRESSGDSSWKFKFISSGIFGENFLELHPNRKLDSSLKKPFIRSRLQGPIKDFFKLPIGIILLFFGLAAMLLLIAKKLVSGMVSRLFLLDYIGKPGSDKIEVDTKYLDKFLNAYQPNKTYLKNFTITAPVTSSLFLREYNFNTWDPIHGAPECSQQEFIIAMTESFKDLYERLWDDLSPMEQYALYDFCVDRYTNYKNTNALFKLIQKGILRYGNNSVDVFSLSFRNYVLSKQHTEEIDHLKNKFSASGTWETMRIPILSIVAVMAIFIVATQSEVTHTLIAVLTSITTLVPLLFKVFERGKPGTN